MLLRHTSERIAQVYQNKGIDWNIWMYNGINIISREAKNNPFLHIDTLTGDAKTIIDAANDIFYKGYISFELPKKLEWLKKFANQNFDTARIEQETEYDVMNWDEMEIEVINRFENDGETETIEIYGKTTDEIIQAINSL